VSSCNCPSTVRTYGKVDDWYMSRQDSDVCCDGIFDLRFVRSFSSRFRIFVAIDEIVAMNESCYFKWSVV
jgi:hypothetical protein